MAEGLGHGAFGEGGARVAPLQSGGTPFWLNEEVSEGITAAVGTRRGAKGLVGISLR